MNKVSQFDENRIDEALAFVNDPKFIGSFEQSIKAYYSMFGSSTKDILDMLSRALGALYPILTFLIYRSRMVWNITATKEEADLISSEIMNVRDSMLTAMATIDDFSDCFEDILPVFDFWHYNKQYREYYQPWADEFRGMNPDEPVPDMNSETFAEYALRKSAEDALQEISVYMQAQGEADSANNSIEKDSRHADKQAQIVKLRRAMSGLF